MNYNIFINRPTATDVESNLRGITRPYSKSTVGQHVPTCAYCTTPIGTSRAGTSTDAYCEACKRRVISVVKSREIAAVNTRDLRSTKDLFIHGADRLTEEVLLNDPQAPAVNDFSRQVFNANARAR